jgi:hypothetical protein
MNQNFELSNVNGLDDSICNAIGIDNNQYSNMINENLLDGLTENTSLLGADGVEDRYSNYTLTSADVQAGAALVGTIAQAAASKPDASGCKKPSMQESFLNRGKWSKYKDCVKNANDLAEKANAAERERTEQQRLKVEQAKLALQQLNTSRVNREADGKILGMPKGLAIGLGVAILGAAVFVTYKIIKR